MAVAEKIKAPSAGAPTILLVYGIMMDTSWKRRHAIAAYGLRVVLMEIRAIVKVWLLSTIELLHGRSQLNPMKIKWSRVCG
ncbi:hypothetical protein X997_4650 [Burkholderia pseudomallei A79C]|nr:hypothetical protein X997_4650 [Burkholderia pseudomallei A79C]